MVKREDDVQYIEAEVFGRGIKMWLLSQAEYLEVLSPLELRSDIEETIARMSEIYRSPEIVR